MRAFILTISFLIVASAAITYFIDAPKAYIQQDNNDFRLLR